MCGRVNIIDGPLTAFILAIIEQAGGSRQPDLPPFDTRYNVAPTESVEVLRHLTDADDDWLLSPMRWWLVPHWAREVSTRYSMFNAKAETLSSSPAYKDSYKFRRCIVPVSGYYEWRTRQGVKTPYYVQAEEAGGLALAGLWDRWEHAGQVIESCTVVTTAAPPELAELHKRMPVSLTMPETRQWLSQTAQPADLQGLLAPRLKVPLVVTPVSSYANNARHKDPGCISPEGDSIAVRPDHPPFK